MITALLLKNWEKKMILLCLPLAGSLVLVYIALVGLSVSYVANRERGGEQISLLRTEVATLESEYLSLSGQITLDLAHQLGYKDVAMEASYAAREKTTSISLARSE